MTLPPGQQRVEGFPRFGTHFHRPPPPIPDVPAIEITGAVTESFAVKVADLATLPRRQLKADFHCVAGWSATDLLWEGVAFEVFYREVIVPVLRPDASITHVSFGGLDGYRSVALLEDALSEKVTIADRLNGSPLGGNHGAPVRLVSPDQYGFMSTKHLCRIELHTAEPKKPYHPSPLMNIGLQLVKPHARARVWEEERHRYIPAWALRRIYGLLIPPIRSASARAREAR